MDRAEFWKNVLCKEDTDEERLIEILRVRGFFIEKNGNQFFLSDNNYKKDYIYLTELLEKYNIGTVRLGEIVIHDASRYIFLEDEFAENTRIGAEASCTFYGWDYFHRHNHGYKASVSWLEPFIARYVKALSSVGVIMVGSCDGNHKDTRELFLQFGDSGSPVWHEILLEQINRNGIDLQWDSADRMCFHDQSKYDCYYSLNSAAKLIYNNRVTLRLVKKKALESYSNSYLRNTDEKIVEKEFRDNVRKLFDNNILLKSSL